MGILSLEEKETMMKHGGFPDEQMRRALLSMMRRLTVKDVFFPQTIVIFWVDLHLLRVIK